MEVDEKICSGKRGQSNSRERLRWTQRYRTSVGVQKAKWIGDFLVYTTAGSDMIIILASLFPWNPKRWRFMSSVKGIGCPLFYLFAPLFPRGDLPSLAKPSKGVWQSKVSLKWNPRGSSRTNENSREEEKDKIPVRRATGRVPYYFTRKIHVPLHVAPLSDRLAASDL